jgi:hypothetical protein
MPVKKYYDPVSGKFLKKRACNVKNMTKLYNALMSGAYEQTQSRLRRGNRFCCLGVACNISGVGTWITDESSIPNHFYVVASGEREGYSLPPEVSAWLGLRGTKNNRRDLIFISLKKDEHGDVIRPLDSRINTYSGTAMNDSEKSFRDIAAEIKRVYLPDDE